MISVIIPVYNVEQYLRRCLESVRSQKYENLEIILVDDGSTDQCGQICDEYAQKDERIKVFHTTNNGLSAARNLGLRQSSGEYIGFVDSDDWIETDMYDLLIHKSVETNADICICGYGYEQSASTKIVKLQENTFTKAEALRELIAENIDYHVWNKLYRKALFNTIRFPDGKNFEDIAIMWKLLSESDTIAVIDSYKYHYRMRDNSITQTYTARNLLDYAEAYINNYYYILARLIVKSSWTLE